MSDYAKMLAPFADEAGMALTIIVVALLLSVAFRRLINSMRDSRHLAPVMARRLQTFQRWTILSLTVLVLMQVLGVFGSAWGLISAALAALAVGFVASWSMLSNMTAALLILTFRPFRVGDTVELIEPSGAAIGGRVVDMSLMYTTLSVEPADGEDAATPRFLCIPNNLFFQKALRTRPAHGRGSEAAFFVQQERKAAEETRGG